MLRYESTDIGPEIAYRIGECGGTISYPNGLITSPLYPAKYPYGADCTYSISQPIDTFLNLTILIFDLHEGYDGNCEFDFLQIRDGSFKESPLIGQFCGKNIPTVIQSTRNQLRIR